MKYIDILEEIQIGHPEIVDRCQEPPLATGTYKDWIGFGVESQKHEASYSEKMENVLFKTLRGLPKTLEYRPGLNRTGQESNRELAKIVAQNIYDLYFGVYDDITGHISDEFEEDLFFIGDEPPSIFDNIDFEPYDDTYLGVFNKSGIREHMKLEAYIKEFIEPNIPLNGRMYINGRRLKPEDYDVLVKECISKSIKHDLEDVTFQNIGKVEPSVEDSEPEI